VQVGLVISVLMHAALLGWALFTIQSQRETRMLEPDPIVTGLVTDSELTKLKQGARTAKQLEAQNKDTPKADVAKKEAAKPKPVAAAPPSPPPPAPKPEPKSDPIAEKLDQPPPPPPAEEQKQREAMLQARQAQEKLRAEEQKQREALQQEQARQAQEKLRAEEQKRAEEQHRAEEQRKADEQRRADEQRKAEEQRLAEEKRKADEERRAEEQKRLEEQRRQAELKKRREDEKRRREAALKRKQEEDKRRQEADAAKQKQFDADKIAALLNKVPDKSAPPPSAPPTEPTKAKGPALGAPEGRDKQISASEIAMLKGMISSRLKVCWRLPSGGGGSDTPVVTLRWTLNPDGSLEKAPEVERPRGGALFQLAAEAAIRAVQQCSPFPLPRDKYVHWKTITWEFDPSQMM
jgi:colicin import membrane protein